MESSLANQSLLYFKEMKRMNKMGPAILGLLRTPPKLSPKVLEEVHRFSVDIRPASSLRRIRFIQDQ
jgi:hypothetical protein